MSQAVADPFSAPSKGGSKYLPLEVRDENGDIVKGDTNCLLGRLVLVTPTKLETGLPDKYNPGKTVDRITADVVVLDGAPLEDGAELPAAFDGQYFSQKLIVSQLTKAAKSNMRGADPARMVLGRVEKLPPKEKGHKPAYSLAEFTPEDAQKARDYLATKDPFA